LTYPEVRTSLSASQMDSDKFCWVGTRFVTRLSYPKRCS
jgi:hypothetical protein